VGVAEFQEEVDDGFDVVLFNHVFDVVESFLMMVSGGGWDFV